MPTQGQTSSSESRLTIASTWYIPAVCLALFQSLMTTQKNLGPTLPVVYRWGNRGLKDNEMLLTDSKGDPEAIAKVL